MSDVDWSRAKELFAEALELEVADREAFVQRLKATNAAIGAEVATLLAAHESAEGAGFLDNLGGLFSAGDLAALDEEAPGEVDSERANETALESPLDAAANDATLDDPRRGVSGDRGLPGKQGLPGDRGRPTNESDHSTLAYSATHPRDGEPPGDGADVTLHASDIVPPTARPPGGDATLYEGPGSRTGDAPKLIADDYEVLDEIGVGGMGVVYRAYQHSLRRNVALKIIPSRLMRSMEQVARFYLEAESAAGLDHPGIVPVQDVGEHDGVHYYAMALVEGGSLAQFTGKEGVGRNKRLPVRRAAEVMERVARAVQYAHDHAVIHRDIKPANILLDRSGQPRLTDFGLAKIAGEDEGLTVTGQVMGTPSYMAPEQAEGKSHVVSNRTDVYSLGATLYALLSGSPPFRAETVLKTLQKVQSAEPDPLPPATPIDLRTICEKCLEKRPAERYESAAALADDLRRYLDGYAISARPLGPWQRLIRWRQRNPLLAGMLMAIAATLVAATVVSTIFGVEASRQARAAAAALAQSEANAQRLSKAIEETFIFASEDLLAEEPGMQAARRTLLESAERYYRELLATGQGSAEKLAGAAQMLGRVRASLGETAAASRSFEQAIELQTGLLSAASEGADAAAPMMNLAQTHNEFAKLGEAIWSARQIDVSTDDARRGLALWIDHSEQCAAWRGRAAEADPADPELRRLLANAKMNLAMPLMEQARWDNEAPPPEADRLLRDAQAIRSDLLKSDVSNAAAEADLARGLATQARLRSLEADHASGAEEVDRLARESLDLRFEAARVFSELPAEARTPDTEWSLATCHQLCGEQLYRLGNVEEAIDEFESMRVVMQRLLVRNPGVGRYRTGLAKALFNLTMLHYASSEFDRGGECFADCQDALLEGVVIRPDGDALSQLVDFTEAIAQSLAEHPDLRPQGVGLLERGAGLLEDAPVPESQRSPLGKASQQLRAAAVEIAAAGEPDSA